MEKYHIDNDIKVFYTDADSFPEGVKPAWDKLHALLGNVKDRKFYGISYGQNGKIIYKAAVEEAYSGEAEKMGCQTFVIPAGAYISEEIKDYMKDVSVIGKTFQKLLSRPDIDPNGFCLEIYKNYQDMICLVGLEK